MLESRDSRTCLDFFVNHAAFGAWSCRDELGHFCDTPSPYQPSPDPTRPMLNGSACASSHQLCVGDGFSPSLHALGEAAAQLECPRNGCHGCPGWRGESYATHLWLAVLLMSASSPIAVMLCLPFLRGERRACACLAAPKRVKALVSALLEAGVFPWRRARQRSATTTRQIEISRL